MRFSFDLGKEEQHRIDFARNCLTGRTTVAVDGKHSQLESPWSFGTHCNFRVVKRYKLMVGNNESHEVVIERQRPRVFGGFFPHDYRVYVDGVVVQKHHGF